jgi:hypothetical protein
MLKVVYAAFAFIFGGFFTNLVNLFLRYFTKRFALGAAALATFLIFLAAFMLALTTIINSLSMAMPNSLTLAMSWFIPSNATACLSAYFAALTAKFVYEMKTRVIQYTLF